MANPTSDEIARAAARAVEACAERGGGSLDYSESSLSVVEETLAEASAFIGQMTPAQLDMLVHDFGCYILEVGRRSFGGRYLWHDQRDQPALVVGEPNFRVAMLAWDRVRSRLGGNADDNIPFFYAGFAERARDASPGTDVLYV